MLNAGQKFYFNNKEIRQYIEILLFVVKALYAVFQSKIKAINKQNSFQLTFDTLKPAQKPSID